MGHIDVEIGGIKKTGNKIVDDFNEMVMFAFNTASGNMLKKGNTLTWNVWFTQPALVDTEEWRTHAERWRKSIQADHGSPTGPGTKPRYFDGTPFKAVDALGTEMEGVLKKEAQDLEKTEVGKIENFIKEHFDDKK